MTCIYSHEDGAYCDKHSHGPVTLSCSGEENCPDRKVLTNANKIHAMTDEELAEFAATIEVKCYSRCGFTGDEERFKTQWLSWLKSPVEEG